MGVLRVADVCRVCGWVAFEVCLLGVHSEVSVHLHDRSLKYRQKTTLNISTLSSAKNKNRDHFGSSLNPSYSHVQGGWLG